MAERGWSVGCSPNQHVPELGELAVLLILHLYEAPLGLTAVHLLPTDGHLPVAADHGKRDELLDFGVGRCVFIVLRSIRTGVDLDAMETKILANLETIENTAQDCAKTRKACDNYPR